MWNSEAFSKIGPWGRTAMDLCWLLDYCHCLAWLVL
jgi:hypothetical protein